MQTTRRVENHSLSELAEEEVARYCNGCIEGHFTNLTVAEGLERSGGKVWVRRRKGVGAVNE